MNGHVPINRYGAGRYRRRPSAVSLVVYLVALAVPVVIALSAIGSSPYLLEKVVPEQFRSSVAALGRHAPGPDGDGTAFHAIADAGADQLTVTGAPAPDRDGWEPRRPEDYPPPAGLVPGVDFDVETTDDGDITHWACGREIPVWSFDAPPGSEADLAWSVETLAFASGLPLRYAGHGAPDQKDGDGGISVTYGDHPEFHGTDIAGIGGHNIWSGGLITQGTVVLRPDQISPVPGDPWTRSLTMHELMHAMGINHAVEYSAEIMAERPGPHPPTVFGHGDRFALHMVGCP